MFGAAENLGVVPRSLSVLFEAMKLKSDYKFQTQMSLVELYNNEFVDLFDYEDSGEAGFPPSCWRLNCISRPSFLFLCFAFFSDEGNTIKPTNIHRTLEAVGRVGHVAEADVPHKVVSSAVEAVNVVTEGQLPLFLVCFQISAFSFNVISLFCM